MPLTEKKSLQEALSVSGVKGRAAFETEKMLTKNNFSK
jgi:hypothetical protein